LKQWIFTPQQQWENMAAWKLWGNIIYITHEIWFYHSSICLILFGAFQTGKTMENPQETSENDTIRHGESGRLVDKPWSPRHQLTNKES
jgi:hypothetical protein